MNPISQQLLLVKYLFRKGADVLAEKGPFSAGLAVSLFQDAVESLLGATAHRVDAKPKETMFGTWNAIIESPNFPKGKTLPLQLAMKTLNNARVNFKHYGNLPDPKDASKFRAHTEDFLTSVCRDVFAIDFESLSSVDLIGNVDVKKHLHLAADAVAKNDANQAMRECALANWFLTQIVENLLPPIPFDWNDFAAMVEGTSIAETRLKQVEETVTTMRNFTLATSLHVPLSDFLRFRSIVPTILEHEGNKLPLDGDWPPGGYRLEDVRFAMGYLVDFTLTLESTIAGVSMTKKKKKSPLG